MQKKGWRQRQDEKAKNGVLFIIKSSERVKKLLWSYLDFNTVPKTKQSRKDKFYKEYC